MLGDKYLIAPMLTPGNRRSVQLPPGKWKDEQGKVYNGGKTLVLDVPLHRLLYFEKL
jgi:alpha-glucosidase